MAKHQGKVYLGFEEEVISEKNLTLLNYTVNKIGGLPDWPPLENLQFPSKCPLCGLHRLLVVQCYAPFENSVYHRTLYLFACISPNCWNQAESWLCIRSQIQDNSTSQSSIVAMPTTDSNMTWCNGADEWDENDNGDSANGNIMSVDNASPKNGMQRNSDEDEESNSFEIETVEQALGNLQVFDAHNANMSPVQDKQVAESSPQKYANELVIRMALQLSIDNQEVINIQGVRVTTIFIPGGAVGAIGAPAAAAELEGGDEPGLVTVDTPTAPHSDLQALLHQTAELPAELRSRLVLGPLQFVPKYIYVEEEWRKQTHCEERVTELLNKYRKENAEIEAPAGDRGCGGGSEDEPYEDAAPLHGDKLFHAFLTRLRDNPGQILRYSRSEPPLLGAALPSAANTPESPRAPTACPRCGARLTCELQLVPEFAETLRLLPSNVQLSHLHFLSVLVFTCSQSCWQPSDSLVQETVVFQPEVV